MQSNLLSYFLNIGAKQTKLLLDLHGKQLAQSNSSLEIIEKMGYGLHDIMYARFAELITRQCK